MSTHDQSERKQASVGNSSPQGTSHQTPKSSVLESPEEVLSTLHKDGKRRWMYPVVSPGHYLTIRRVVAYVLILLFFGLPLITIKEKPAIFIDIMNGEFTFFGLTFWRTDLIILMFGVLTVLLSVVYVTSLFGRAWCGWGCPQTVYMEFVFRPIERLIEGKENQRKKRDEKGSFSEKIWRKAIKYALYLIVAVTMANGFVAYFVSWDALIHWMILPPTDHWPFFVMMLVTTGLIFFNFTYFREQMCTIACPYARIQSVLLDRHSMIVSYDPSRGEKRGKRNRKQRKAEEAGENIGLGDCVDCDACVRTCPTGIDIRNGLQMECISCTQCIDACSAIMEKMNKPQGLIRYTSMNELDHGLMQKGLPPKYGKPEDVVPPRLFRPRTIIYTVVICVAITGFFTFLALRSPIEVTINRIVEGMPAPFIMSDKKTVQNRVQFVLSNRTTKEQQFEIRALSPEGLSVIYPVAQATAKPGRFVKVDTFVQIPKKVFSYGKAPAVFQVRTVGHEGDYDIEEKFTLLGPD